MPRKKKGNKEQDVDYLDVAIVLCDETIKGGIDAHEKTEHGGARCQESRVMSGAYLLCSLGLLPENLPAVKVEMEKIIAKFADEIGEALKQAPSET